MRNWIKYLIVTGTGEARHTALDRDFRDHARGMGNYDPDDAYASKIAFFKKYYYGFHYGRLERYDDFLRSRLGRSLRILSIASGRCANELRLIEDGYDITCSDLEKIPALSASLRLFPGLRFRCLDILKSPAPERYDAVLALSLIYLFDGNDLKKFFCTCRDSLQPGGSLILDSAGAPDNWPAFFWHDVYLRFEASLLQLLLWLRTGRLQSVTRKHFGYRRTNAEIVSAARFAGFDLAFCKSYASVAEFRRSVFFNYLVKPGSLFENIFATFGRSFPYTRMFDFRKVV
jgi:SAM-dependent methyltransferase